MSDEEGPVRRRTARPTVATLTEENQRLREETANQRERLDRLEQTLANLARASPDAADPRLRRGDPARRGFLANIFGLGTNQEPQQNNPEEDAAQQPDDDQDEQEPEETPDDDDAPNPPPPPRGMNPDDWQAMYNFMLLSTAAANAARPAPTPHLEPERAQINPPAKFDGTNPRKVREFLDSCELAFRQRPRTYATGTARINFAMQYLEGSPQRWITNSFNLPADETPQYLSDWDAFRRTVLSRYGETDPQKAAVRRLRSLRMADTHKCHRYTVEFEGDEDLCGYNDTGLYDLYYDGLAPRIREVFKVRNKPATLEGVKSTAEQIDAWYWDYKEENERDKPKNPKSDGNSGSSGKSNSAPRSSANQNSGSRNSGFKSKSNNSGNRNNNNRNNNNSGQSSSNNRSSNSGNKSRSNNNLGNKLGEDGKLTEEEKERRRREGLCLFCGKSGHMLKECPNRPNSDAAPGNSAGGSNNKSANKNSAKARSAAANAPPRSAAAEASDEAKN
jgi:hypothetical protein